MTSRARNPLTDAEKARIHEMHTAGATRNDIARDLGRSGDTITRYCKKAGLDFDREQIRAATEARKIDLAARRASLRERLLHEADAALDVIGQPETVWNFGGRDNTYAEHTFPAATSETRRKMILAAAAASTQEIRIAQADSGANVEAAKSLLTGLAEALGVKGPAEQPQADDDE